MATIARQKLHQTRIDIPEANRQELIGLLNENLASVADLKTQVKQAHWNVKGKDFYQLHLLFDEMATELEEFTDLIAERAVILGGTAMGTARMAASNSKLSEYPADIASGKDHIKALIDRYAVMAQQVRESIDRAEAQDDADTADLFTEVSRGVDKRLWFLEAHIQD